MKFKLQKKWLVLVAILVAGNLAAQNQTPLPQIFGTLDMGVAHLRGQNNITGIASGGANISRIGFRGTFPIYESPLKIGYWLEMGINPDTGSGAPATKELSFNRRSTLSLMGDFGELRIGRDDSATFLSTLIFDPFLTNGVAGTMTFMMLGAPGVANVNGGAPIQISNSVSYFLPQELIKGFSLQLQSAFGEKSAATYEQSKRRDYYGTRLGYKIAALNLAFAAGRLYGDDATNNLDIANLALSYDFKSFKPSLITAIEKRKNKKIIASQLGLSIPIFKSSAIKTSIAHFDKQELGFKHNDYHKIGLGYEYNFSLQTKAYIYAATIINRQGSNVTISGVQGLTAQAVNNGANASGIQFGWRHFF